jgi:hypothetical protein
MNRSNELAAAIRHIPIPPRMAARPLSERGFPVPFFVAWVDDLGKLVRPGLGRPDFRVTDRGALFHAVSFDACWMCGQPLGKFRSLVLGPMCLANRMTAEPSCHPDCAEYAARACPFLANPRARRNEHVALPPGSTDSESHIRRNPGVVALYVHTARKLRRLARKDGPPLFHLPVGEPHRLTFWRDGRMAPHAEVMESIDTGLPLLEDQARRQSLAAVEALEACYLDAVRLVARWTSDTEHDGRHEAARPAAAVPG